MLYSPMIPIWLMGVICVLLLFCRRRGKRAFVRQIIIVILLFLINLRPMRPGKVQELGEEKLDSYVLFVIDDTISMVAKDHDGGMTRLEGVSRDCAAIVDALEGAHFSVISFHNTANRLTPYTDNARHVKNVIEAVYPIESLYANGTDMNVAKDAMIAALKDAAARTDGKLSVFFVSDGEITSEKERLGSFAEVAPYVENGAVLGYGTESGGQMELKNLYDSMADATVVMDYSAYPAKPAVSKIDEANLKQIAKDLGLPYIHMTDEEKLDEVIKKILGEAHMTREKKIVTESADPYLGAEDLYFILVIPLLGLLLWEAFDLIKKRAVGG